MLNNGADYSTTFVVDATDPTVISTTLVAYYSLLGPATFNVTYSEYVDDPVGDAGADDVTNPVNYLVVEDGANGVFDTVSCAGGLQADDQGIAMDSVSYASGSQTATMNINGGVGLPVGTYQLYVCGSTSIVDLSGNPLYGGSDYRTSFVVDGTSPTVTTTSLQASYTQTGPASFEVTYSEDVADPAGDSDPDDVTNPANYLLVEEGANGSFDTVTCTGGLQADDQGIAVDSASYASGTQTATVNINGGIGLSEGVYQLLVCGTTSIVDLAGNPINGGVDYQATFMVNHRWLPDTGFPQGVTPRSSNTAAPEMDQDMLFGLEIPSLGVQMPIIGVPQTENSWDVSWLGNNAGWLHSSAFPTWTGNTVITGHVWDANNHPGPFALLKSLSYGDIFYIHAFGRTYQYKVQENQLVGKGSTWRVFQHEDYDWVTLLTCEGYDPYNMDYTHRRMVRGVLIGVK